MDSSTSTSARLTFVFRVVVERVKSSECIVCDDGRLHFRKQDQVNFKLHPGIDGLQPFTTIDVPACVGEASHAPVVKGNA